MSSIQSDLQFSVPAPYCTSDYFPADGDGQFSQFQSTPEYDPFTPPKLVEPVRDFSPDHFELQTPSPTLLEPSLDFYASFLDSDKDFGVGASGSSSSSPPRRVGSRMRPPGHVPRPRNAFMIFRSEFWAQDKISRTVERDHRHISRIIGHCWNEMPDEEKAEWRLKAQREKVDHEMKYPGYRFTPGVRTKKPVKRNVKRNGTEELLRCRQVAELLLSGKQGGELETAVLNMEPIVPTGNQLVGEKKRRKQKNKDNTSTSTPSGAYTSNVISDWNTALTCAKSTESPIFRSPLLPPYKLVPHSSPQSGPDFPSFPSTPQSSPYRPYQASGCSQGDQNFQFSSPSMPSEGIYHQGSTYSPHHYAFDAFPASDSNPPYESMIGPQHMESQSLLLFSENDHTHIHTHVPPPQSTSTPSTVCFQNPFDSPFNLPPISFANITRAPVDPLQWDYTSFSSN